MITDNGISILKSEYFTDKSDNPCFKFITNRFPEESPIGDRVKIVTIKINSLYEFKYSDFDKNIIYEYKGIPYYIISNAIFIKETNSNTKKVLFIDKILYVKATSDNTTRSNSSESSGDDQSDDDYTFKDNMIFTKDFGKFKPDATGSVVIPSKNKNIEQLLMEAYSQEIQPSIVQPSIIINSPQCKAYEVGTVVTPSYSITFNKGSYSYGPDTGVTPKTYTIKLNNETKTTATGNFSPITILDNTNIRITGTVIYTDGVFAKTNLKNDTTSKINAGSTNGQSDIISGYRNTFYGTITSKDNITSNIIRGLANKSNMALNNGSTFDMTIPVGAVRIIIAYPASLRDLNNVLDVNGMNASIKGSFIKSTLSVEGSNGSAGIDYKIYTLDYAEPNKNANTYKVTI